MDYRITDKLHRTKISIIFANIWSQARQASLCGHTEAPEQKPSGDSTLKIDLSKRIRLTNLEHVTRCVVTVISTAAFANVEILENVFVFNSYIEKDSRSKTFMFDQAVNPNGYICFEMTKRRPGCNIPSRGIARTSPAATLACHSGICPATSLFLANKTIAGQRFSLHMLQPSCDLPKCKEQPTKQLPSCPALILAS